MKEPHPHHFDASIGTTMDVIVSADNVTRDYDLGKVRVHALRGVTLYVGRGEFLSVAGPSGSGKTTLLNLIGCVDTPTSGAVRIDGRDTRALSERELTKLRLHKIGFIFQSFNLISVLSLQQNVEFPLLLQGGLTRAERRKRVEELLAAEVSQARRVADEGATDAAERERRRADLERARSEEFWAEFGRDPLGSLEFLENRIAPLSVGGGYIPLRYVATDLGAFAEAFDGLRVVAGTPVPPGVRGILLGKRYAEMSLKLRAARRLDEIKEARDRDHARIASDERLQQMVRENQASIQEILLQLDPGAAREAVARLGRGLRTDESDLARLLVLLFTTDDGNFEERYRLFYSELAPLVRLYSAQVGDTITLEAPGRSGYTRSVNVKVYGMVEFKGLERSDIAGMTSLMDLAT